MTSADLDPALAAALGRFSQACNSLERLLEKSLCRILPVTDDIGRVLLSGNQMRRNIEILRALTLLREVPLSDEQREQIKGFCARATAINDDRSRLLHNPIQPGPNGYVVVVHKSDGKSSAAMPITTEFISSRAEEAGKLSHDLMQVPHLAYDLGQWGKAWPAYPLKAYPEDQTQPSPRRHGEGKNRKR